MPCTSTCVGQPNTKCEVDRHLADNQEGIETDGPTDKNATKAEEESKNASNESSDDKDSSKSPEPSSPAAPVREVNLPNPLPSYITKMDKPPSRGKHCVLLCILSILKY